MNRIMNRLKYEWMYLRKIEISFRGIWFLLIVVKDSLKWCFSINIGNYLKHNNRLYYVNNGASLGYWDCLEVDSDFQIKRPDGNLAIRKAIKKEGAVKVYRLNTPVKDFMQGFRFFMGYWYGIWVYKKGSYNERPSGIRKRK